MVRSNTSLISHQKANHNPSQSKLTTNHQQNTKTQTKPKLANMKANMNKRGKRMKLIKSKHLNKNGLIIKPKQLN